MLWTIILILIVLWALGYGFLPAAVPPLLDRISDAVAPRLKTKSYLVAHKV